LNWFFDIIISELWLPSGHEFKSHHPYLFDKNHPWLVGYSRTERKISRLRVLKKTGKFNCFELSYKGLCAWNIWIEIIYLFILMLLLQLNLISRGIYSKHTQKSFLLGWTSWWCFFFFLKKNSWKFSRWIPIKNNNVFDFKFLPLYR